jgi:hypothetical protein
MEDEERGCSGWSAWGAQHGQRPRAHGHRVAGGDRCGPPRVVGVQLDLPVRRAADVGEAEGGRLPPGIDEDERFVIQQRPPALVQVGCGRPDQVQRDRPGAGPLPVSPPAVFVPASLRTIPRVRTTSLEPATFFGLAHAGSL